MEQVRVLFYTVQLLPSPRVSAFWCSMMRSIGILLVLVLAIANLLTSGARAAIVESRIEVPSRSDSARASGTARALLQVLDDLYPTDHPITPSQRQEVAREAASFVQRYGYLTGDDGQTILRLQFDETAIRSRVDDFTVAPVETVGVEPVLLWLVVEQATRDLLLTEGAGGLLPETLDQIAEALGQPLVYPRDDALDRGDLTTLDIRNADPDKLLPASQQYPVRRIIALNMAAEGDRWRGDWTSLATGERWSSTGSLGDMLQIGLSAYQGLQAVADGADDFTHGGTGLRRGEVTFSVGGALKPADYAWLLRQLRDRFARETVRVTTVSASQFSFAVKADDGIPAVAQTLASIPQLQAIPTPPSEGPFGEWRSEPAAAPVADLSYLLAR